MSIQTCTKAGPLLVSQITSADGWGLNFCQQSFSELIRQTHYIKLKTPMSFFCFYYSCQFRWLVSTRYCRLVTNNTKLTSVTLVTPKRAESGSCTSIFLHSSITEAKQESTSTEEWEYFTSAVTTTTYKNTINIILTTK